MNVKEFIYVDPARREPDRCTAAASSTPALSRREMLLRCANGFGALALAALLREPAFGAALGEAAERPPTPARAAAAALHRGEGPNVIFLYMDGGPSQVDTFDPKPRLDREHGQPIKVKTQPTQFNNVGNVLQVPLEVPPVRRERHPGQRPVPARRPRASTTWRSSGRWSRTSPSTPAPTTSCTPAAASRAGPSHGAWVDLRPGQRVPATCPASSSSTAA